MTIGVVINLGNYESLRLEVSDCVQTEWEADELAAYLNRVLDGYGQNDAATRASIDKYRARVLEKHEAEIPTAPAADPLDELFGPIPASEVMGKKEETVISEPSLVVPVFDPEQVSVKVAEASPEKTMEDPVTYTCENCGSSVSKVQRDVSNLFMGKTLCKACMK